MVYLNKCSVTCFKTFLTSCLFLLTGSQLISQISHLFFENQPTLLSEVSCFLGIQIQGPSLTLGMTWFWGVKKEIQDFSPLPSVVQLGGKDHPLLYEGGALEIPVRPQQKKAAHFHERPTTAYRFFRVRYFQASVTRKLTEAPIAASTADCTISPRCSPGMMLSKVPKAVLMPVPV